MTDLFPPLPLLTAFVVASLVLAVTPGPAVLYLVTRTLVHGRQQGLVSIAAVAVGNLGNAFAASLGVAALLAVSEWAFILVKWAGAGYLVFLGLQMWRAPPANKASATSSAPSHRSVFRDGVLVALLNPKTTLFFAAFVPQFLGDPAHAMQQSLVLGVLFVLMAAVTDTVYVLAAGVMAPALQSAQLARGGRCLGGAVFVGLGLWTALAGRPHPG